jgi:GcrA cell cycle regulator
MAKRWSEEQIEQIRQWRRDGISCGRIAEMLETSRNAIIGLCRREEIPAPSIIREQAKNSKKRKRSKRERASWKQRRKKMGTLPETPPEPPTARHLDIMALTSRTCRWPLWDAPDGPRTYCGAETQGEGPYCAYHTSLAFRPIEPRKGTTFRLRSTRAGGV